MTKLIPVVSNFKSEPIRPPVVAAETEKIETYIKETFGGEIYAAYGCSLGGSFVSLLAGRKHIHIDYAIIGLSDMDQAPKWLAKLETALMIPLMYPLITGQGGGPMKTGCLFLTFLFFLYIISSKTNNSKKKNCAMHKRS